jgi:hypothetical protein
MAFSDSIQLAEELMRASTRVCQNKIAGRMKAAWLKASLKASRFQGLPRFSLYLAPQFGSSLYFSGRQRAVPSDCPGYKGSDAKLGSQCIIVIRIHAFAIDGYEDVELYVSRQAGVSTGGRGN